MLRWLILTATFVVWAACMIAVHRHCQPPPLQEVTPGLESGLDRLFEADNEPRRVWRVFADLERLKQGSQQRGAQPWTGQDETELTEVGWLDSTLRKRERDESRLEQVTEAVFAIPGEVKLPLLQMMGTLHYQSRSDVSRDLGLEVFSASFTLGLGLEVRTHGVREGAELRITQQIFQKGKKLLDEQQSVPLGARGMPLLELFPFQQNRDIREGRSWDIAMLDTSVADLENKARPRVVGLRVKCTGRQKITSEDDPNTMAFTVTSEDGKARAWYSADGTVLKQAYTLGEVLEVMLVRADPLKFRRRPLGRR